LRTFTKLSLGLLLAVTITNANAITVNVSSTSKNITALGFTTNGSKHGGLGSTYHASGMPKGSYAFGVRAHGKDIPCYGKDGKKTVKLTKSTKATLEFKGKHCTVDLGSK
jgi:hypothetical protein